MVNQKKDLGFLGIDYQYKLVSSFFADGKFFTNMCHMVDQNMFTETNLRTIVGVMKDYHTTYELTPSYEIINIQLNSISRNEQETDLYNSTIQKLKNVSLEGLELVKDKATNFFKQQNLIKTINKIQDFIKEGNSDRYYDIEEMIKQALQDGNKDIIGTKLTDNLGDVLSEDHRKTTTTGVSALDKCLEGGLGKGEIALIIGPSGFGKALDANEIVATPNGYVRNGDLKVGDYVIGSNGKPTKVTGVYPQGIVDLYKVSFDDKTSCVCCKEHLWNVNSKYQRVGKKYVKGSGHANMKKEYRPDLSFKTLSLGEIMEKGIRKGKSKSFNFKIPNTPVVEFNQRDINREYLPPYLLGVMIGDGCFSRMSFCTVDMEIIQNVEAIYPYVISIKTYERNKNLHNVRLNSKTKEALKKYFTLSEKSGDKFIPEDYLYSSVEDRIELLNGLMDTDGTCGKNGCSSYNTKSKRLAEDIRTLVLSLGGTAIMREKKCSYFSKKYNKTIDCGIQYELTIRMKHEHIPLFKLSRKQERVVYKTKAHNDRFISNVEFSHKGEAVCIKVEAEDELYLTRDFIVTHNTSLTTCMANSCALSGKKVVQIYFEDKDRQIQRKHIGKITEVEARDLSKPEFKEYVKSQIEAKDEQIQTLNNNLILKKFNTGEINVPQLRHYLKQLMNTGFIPDMVIVDYFECLTPSNNIKDPWKAEANTMRQLESLASDLDIALWIPTQGTKESVNAEIVTMDKAGGSFAKIQIAHIVISISRSNDDIKNNMAKFCILKNRAGKSGDILENVYFNNGTCIINADNSTISDNVNEYEQRNIAKKEEEKANMVAMLLNKTQDTQSTKVFDDAIPF